MVFKQSRFGRFIGCSGYPECKNIKKITLGIPCPQEGCGGELVENRSKRGRAYFGCSRFPDCRFVVWQRPVATPCPKCGMPFLTQRGGRGKRWVACAREGCDYRRDAEIA
jgi:DNA topoisomerase-1